MIQKAIWKLSLPLFASAGITAAGLILYQRISLHRAKHLLKATPPPTGFLWHMNVLVMVVLWYCSTASIPGHPDGNGVPRSKNWQKIFGYTP